MGGRVGRAGRMKREDEKRRGKIKDVG